MSIVPNARELPAIFGSVSIGTITGETLYSAPFETSDGTPVAQVQLDALESVWRAMPEVLASNGSGRFDFVITQASNGDVPTPLLWDSGLSAGGLCGAVARKLLKLRMHVYAPTKRPHATGVDVTEVPHDTVEWEPVDHTARVRDQLAQQINAWEGRS